MKLPNCRCGGTAEMLEGRSGFWVRCDKCYTRTYNFDTIQEAKKIWRQIMKKKTISQVESIMPYVLLIGVIGMFVLFAISISKVGSGVEHKVKEYQRGLENEINARRVTDEVILQYLYSHAHEGLEGRKVIIYDEVSE